ncbi:hypothetical protein JCM11251_002595 [Rhodosporidiobolus azoricus]
MARRRLSINRHPSTAPRLPDFLQRSTVWAKFSAFASNHLNFYRIHLLVFTFVPLIVSGIFYASNGPSEENQIPYIDALFMCTSAMTVTGLNSVLLARLTLWQTVIIFLLMAIGSPPSVSIIVLLIRRQFFRNKFNYMVANDARIRDRINEIGAQEAALHGRSYHPFDGQHHRSNLSHPWFTHLLSGSRPHSSPVTPRPSPVNSNFPTRDEEAELKEKERLANGKGKKRKKLQSLTADMIKRVDVPVRINEMSVSGRLGEGRDRGEGEGGKDGETRRQKEERELREKGIVRIDGGGDSEDEDGEERGARTAPDHAPLPFTRPAAEGDGALPTVFADEDDDDVDEAEVGTRRTGRPTQRQESGDGPFERHMGEFVSDSPRLMTPEAVERPFVGAAGHPRAIQIDESSKPARTLRGRRSSDSAASPHRTPGGNFPRVRTLDHRHLDQITESPSLTTPTSPTFPRRDLDMGRTRTIEFRDPADYPDLRLRRQRTLAPLDPDFPTPRRMSHSNLRDMHSRTLTRTGTVAPIEQSAMHTGFGGFPNPLVAAASLAKSKLPALRGVVERNMTMPRTTTIMSTHSHHGLGGGTGTGIGEQTGGVKTGAAGIVKPVTYISFDAVVGRNSKFHGLTTAQQEELGGVEYRALTVLLRIVPAYWLLSQLIAVLCLAPWLTYSGTYKPVFDGPEIDVSPTWFVFFQVWSSFSNNGMSLSDSSMIPFQRAYWLIIVQCLLILGGNTAFPVFLRLVIWILSHIVPRRSRTRETLQFLLDHPRRCFIYLFPSHQTWFLVFTLVCLNGIDWAAFCILDIGNPVIEAIPVGTRIIDGLFQAFAVRAAGFAIVPLSQVAPALQLLYVIMMYIAVYPIAVSIRTTNVYEEKSMGVYDEDFDEDPDDVEARFERSHSATQYIGYHARKQLAFDLWWLALAVWLICIVERHRIGSSEWPEVTIFSLIFEITSAYGTVGLSLGNNRNNTSLSGVLSTLSKLIVIAVMVRGRHRGLPIAIDRAVLLPSDLEKHLDDTATAASVDNPNNEFGLRSRGTRASFSSHTAPMPGGLERVEPLTDEARAEIGRQASQTSPSYSAGEANVAGTGTPGLVERDLTDSSQEYLAESGTSSSGKETVSGEAEAVEMRELSGKKVEVGVAEEKAPPTDRNQVGWR